MRFCRNSFIPLFAALLLGSLFPLSGTAQDQGPPPGIVLMHGKGGSPEKHVAELASSLTRRGFLVANLEMPWSGRRDYDGDVQAAESEVAAALASLRQRGAGKVFVAGHSQGGLFALHVGGRQTVAGIIAIAPGGNVASPLFREKLGESVDQARRLVAEGKGQDRSRFADFESSRGVYPLVTTPAAYLSWFAPEGAMNQARAIRAIGPATPVLYIVPGNDYPGLLKVKQDMFGLLPGHPLTRLYEPNSSHLGAPSAAAEEIANWVAEVVTSPQATGIR